MVPLSVAAAPKRPVSESVAATEPFTGPLGMTSSPAAVNVPCAETLALAKVMRAAGGPLPAQ